MEKIHHYACNYEDVSPLTSNVVGPMVVSLRSPSYAVQLRIAQIDSSDDEITSGPVL